MSDELDLETGDPGRGDAASERRRRRRESSTTEAPKQSGGIENEVRSRLARVFDRIAKAREAQEDHELAEVIREDTDAMTQGFVSLTSNVPFLRMPLVMALNILEPVLAFSRVGRIILIRVINRRNERFAEQEPDEGQVDPYTVEQA